MTVIPANSSMTSSATIRIFPMDAITGAVSATEKYAPIGGNVLVGLEVRLAPHERVADSSATLRIADNYDPEKLKMDAVIGLTSSSGWWIYTDTGWRQATQGEVPGDENTTDEVRMLWYPLADWNTREEPYLDDYIPHIGHNGEHTLRLLEGTLEFEVHYEGQWLPAVSVGPTPRLATVKNLVITNVSTSNGTVDYFKYDPLGPPELSRPTITFTVEDEGDPHAYDCYVIVRPTGAYAWTKPDTDDCYGWMCAFLSNGTTSATVPLTWDGSTGPGNKPDTADWGTYTFEVYAHEYPYQEQYADNYLDWFYYKWPYCLSIGDSPQNPDHEVWYTLGADTQVQLRCKYKLSDYAWNQQYDVGDVHIML